MPDSPLADPRYKNIEYRANIPRPHQSIAWGRIYSTLRSTDQAIALHSSAQFLQTSAHFLQCSICECFSHSSAQALQISAHSSNKCSPCREPLESKEAVSRQTSAQSISSRMHLT